MEEALVRRIARYCKQGQSWLILPLCVLSLHFLTRCGVWDATVRTNVVPSALVIPVVSLSRAQCVRNVTNDPSHCGTRCSPCCPNAVHAPAFTTHFLCFALLRATFRPRVANDDPAATRAVVSAAQCSRRQSHVCAGFRTFAPPSSLTACAVACAGAYTMSSAPSDPPKVSRSLPSREAASQKAGIKVRGGCILLRGTARILAHVAVARACVQGVLKSVYSRVDRAKRRAGRLYKRSASLLGSAKNYAWAAGTTVLIVALPVLIELQRETTFAMMREDEERRQNEMISDARKQAVMHAKAGLA